MSSSFDVERCQQIATQCDRQVRFATSYAPLYAHLFGMLATWLRAPGAIDDPIVRMVIDASRERAIFDAPLLLLAALHREVLSGTVPELGRFYPTAGGNADFNTPEFAQVVRDAILFRPKTIAAFVRTANVQTNETARGMIWLLPLQAWPVSGVHLVDLGAGAGLNLVAERRNYRYFDEERLFLELGAAAEPQFATHCSGATIALPQAAAALPPILTRLGCDAMPFALDSAENEITLAAYVWADQPQRLQRLREGLAAFHAYNHQHTPVQVTRAFLPNDLDAFLSTVVTPALAARPSAEPVVLYNTYVTNYLADKGASLAQIIDRWAVKQARLVLWLQWEPAYERLRAPEYSWLAYSAELWRNASRQQWHLGWVHPHGTQFAVDPAWTAFCAALQKR